MPPNNECVGKRVIPAQKITKMYIQNQATNVTTRVDVIGFFE